MVGKTRMVCSDDEQLFVSLFARSMSCLKLRGGDEEERENERDMAFLYSRLASVAIIA